MYRQYTAAKKYVFLVVLNIFLFGLLSAQGRIQNGNVNFRDSSSQAIKHALTIAQKKLGTNPLAINQPKIFT